MPDQPAPVVAVRRVDHVGIAVPDLDGALDFFKTIFGLRLELREKNADQGVEEAMLTPELTSELSARSSPGSRGGAPGGTQSSRLQLVSPLTPDSTVARYLARRGSGMHHLAFEVDDVEAAATALRGHGLRVIFDDPRPGASGTRVNFVHPGDSFGVLVELVEIASAIPVRHDY